MNRFLALCGPQTEQDGGFAAPLQTDRYRPRRDPAFAEAGMPAALLVEAMAQHACRASSHALFGGRRTVPAQISDLVLPERPLDESCRLVAAVAVRGQLGWVQCRVVGPDGGTLAQGTFTTAVLQPQNEPGVSS